MKWNLIKQNKLSLKSKNETTLDNIVFCNDLLRNTFMHSNGINMIRSYENDEQ